MIRTAILAGILLVMLSMAYSRQSLPIISQPAALLEQPQVKAVAHVAQASVKAAVKAAAVEAEAPPPAPRAVAREELPPVPAPAPAKIEAAPVAPAPEVPVAPAVVAQREAIRAVVGGEVVLTHDHDVRALDHPAGKRGVVAGLDGRAGGH